MDMKKTERPGGDEISTEDSLTRYSDKPDPGDSMPDEGSNPSDTKNVAKVKEEELCESFQQFLKDGSKSDTGTRENETLFDNSGTEYQKGDEDTVNLVQFFSAKTPYKPSFSTSDAKSEKNRVSTVKNSPVCLPGCVTGPFSEAEAFKEIINTLQNQSVPMKDAKIKSAEPYLHVTPEEGRKILDGTQIQQPKGCFESLLKMFHIHSPENLSGDANRREKHKVKEHVEDVVPMSSLMSGSRNDNMAKPEETRIISVPMCPIVWKNKDIFMSCHSEMSQEKFAKVEPTTTMKDSLPNEAVRIKDIMTLEADVVPMSSVMSGSRNDNMAKPEETRIISVPMCPIVWKNKDIVMSCHSEKPSLKVKTEEKKKVLDDPENKQPQVEITRKKYKINQREVSQILYDSEEDTDDNDEFTKQRKNRNADHQKYFLKKNEEHDGHTEKTSNEKSKVRKEINAMEHLDESQPSVTASVDFQVTYPNYKDIWEHLDEPCTPCEDSHNLPKIQNAVDSCQRIVERETSHGSQCLLYMQEMEKMENKFCAMKEELSKKENENSELEQREIKWKQELCKLRHDLEEKEKKLRDFENMNNQLSEKEEKHNKEIELNKELQQSSGTLKTELKTARSNSNQVSTRNETEKELLHKYHMLKDEYDMLNLEMNKMKCQNEKEKKKYLYIIDASREKCDDLQRTIKSIEETLNKITFQYKEEINFMKAEITKLNIKLENKEQNTERQETEVKSYSASQAVAPHPCDERQTSKRERELLSQRARDECLDLKDEGNFKISKRNIRRLIQFPKFSKPGIKCRSQGKGPCIHIRHDLRKMTLVLNQVQRDLKETQCHVNEMKRMYQNEQSQNYKERESIDEKLFQMESEITLLGQQFHDLCNKVDDREDLLVYTQEQCNIIKIIQNEAENSIHELQNSSMELMNRNCHFKERLNQYKKKSEGKVVVRQLQQELADNLTEQFMSEASLEHSSSNHPKVKDEAWGLTKKLDKITCEADKLNTKLEVTSSKYLQLNEQYELSLKSLQNTCEKLQNNQKKLEEYVANFKRYMQNNITEHGQEEPHKWETEQRTREILEEHQKQASPFSETYTAASKTLEELYEDDKASLLRLMQSRIHKLESQVSENNNEISDEIQSPHRITRSLQEVHSGFPVKKQRGCSPCSHCGRPVPGCPCLRLKRDNWLHNRSFIQGENIAGATSNPQPSFQSIEDYLAEMNEKLSRDFI